jgi:hypothetical protein
MIAFMLRKHAALLIAMMWLMLVATACIVRNGPRRGNGNSYRSAPSHGNGHGKHKKAKCWGERCR